MRKMKKLLSLLVAATMTLAMAAPTFADDLTGSITLDNPIEAKTYTAYKIFDVTYTEGGAYAYTISIDNPWFSDVKTYADTTENGLTLTETASGVYNVTTTKDFSAADLAEELKKVEGSKTGGKPLNASGNDVAVSGLELGYYFVSTNSGSLCNLTTTNPDAEIHDKNDFPDIKKEVTSDKSVQIGDTVSFEITGTVPDTTGYETYRYEISDTMGKGLKFNRDLKVFIGDNDITSSDMVTDQTDTGFKVTIPVKNYTFGATIKVSYTATVTSNASAVVTDNTATLVYSNDPNAGTVASPANAAKDSVYSAKIAVDKYVKDHTDQKLAGAKFVLYKEETVSGQTEPVKKYYKLSEVDGKLTVTWEDAYQANDTTMVKTTGDGGATTFEGLKDGTYYLVEIEAPSGYNLLDEAVKVEIADSNVLTDPKTDQTILTHTEGIGNSAGAQLPSTGGIGTTIFYAAGIILMAGAVFFVVRRKKA